jgi:glycosyltransferase involved in cell wall biosynthesis
MRIVFDATTLRHTANGVNNHIHHTLTTLLRIDRDNEYLVVLPSDTPERGLERLGARVTIRTIRPRVRALWIQTALPALLREWRADVLHAPCYLAPVTTRVPTVVTVHDMASFLFPEKFVLAHRIVYGTLVPLSIRRAAAIITVSNFTRMELRRLTDVPEERVFVVYNAADAVFSPSSNGVDPAAVRARYGIPERYLLFVGVLEPRKNVIGLLESFAAVRDRIPHSLVLAGRSGWQTRAVFAAIERLRLHDRVVRTDYVPPADLVVIYRHADGFVYPSFYEGFGMPVLEAMSCGVPVITSNRSALPEVTGDAAVLVAPEDRRALGEAMVRVVSDGRLRDDLRLRGLARARAFSWEESARATLDVYRAAAARGNR